MPESQRRPTLSSYTSGNSYFYASLVMGAIILVSSATLATYKKSITEKIDDVHAKILAGDKARNPEHEKALITASKQSKVMRQLLDNKLYWTQAFKRIEQMTQSSVTFLSFDAAVDKGSITFKASADSYASVAKQLAAFAAATGITEFSIGKIESTALGTVEFSGELKIDQKAMLMKASPTPSSKPKP